MVPWRDAQTHVLTHTLHYGLGVFEGVRLMKLKKELQFLDFKSTQIVFLTRLTS